MWRDAGAVADIGARPQLAEALTGGRQLVDQRARARIGSIAADDVTQPAHRYFGRLIPIDIELAGGGFEKAPAQEILSGWKPGDSARAQGFAASTSWHLPATTAGIGN